MVGQTLGNYRIVAKLGNGAMGEVFLADHQRIARRAAIKVLNQDLTTNPRLVARFLDEARATSLIRHPGIVEVFDCDVAPSGRVYLVMEYLEGQTLAARLNEQPRLPWPMACQIARQMAQALGAAHEMGIIHRDIKPENVFLSPDATQPLGLVVRVLDFGIAKLLSADPVDGARTVPGMLVGTPDYMAPEQCAGTEPLDQRADIYALGCVLFRMLTGRLPFVGPHFRDVMTAHMFHPPPPLAGVEPPTPGWLEELVACMLEKEPAERPPSMQVVARILARADHGAHTTGTVGASGAAAASPLEVLRRVFTRRQGPAALLGAGCALLMVVGLLLWAGRTPPDPTRAVVAVPVDRHGQPPPEQQPPVVSPATAAAAGQAPLANLTAADASVDRAGAPTASKASSKASSTPSSTASSTARVPSAQPRPAARRETGRTRPAHPPVEMDGLVDL